MKQVIFLRLLSNFWKTISYEKILPFFLLTVMQYDTPAIIADILGLEIPADWRGRPYPEIYR
ncbi:MAG: hypothetical protein IJP81_06910 [Bacteroidales bacterium]|nr:hypothetical protein [Bacteroidales bacterium]